MPGREAPGAALDLAHAIAHYVPEGIYAIDPRGRVTFVNPAAETLLGWGAAELLDRSAHEAFHGQGDDGAVLPAEACPFLSVLRSGETLRDHQDLFTRKDGTRLPVLCSCAAFRRDGQVA